MDYKKLETAVYCEGFVEDFIENTVATSAPSKQMEELLFAWHTLSEAFNILRKEVVELEYKLHSARSALT